LDNGPQFTAQEFEKYVERHQIKHVKTLVYHLQSNGQAKNFVKTFKQALKKNITENTNTKIELIMARFLLDYRIAVHATTKVCPAEFFMGRKLRMRLNIVRKSNETTKEEAVTQISKRKLFEEGFIIRDYSTTDKNK
jgi:transposase InsO family protein